MESPLIFHLKWRPPPAPPAARRQAKAPPTSRRRAGHRHAARRRAARAERRGAGCILGVSRGHRVAHRAQRARPAAEDEGRQARLAAGAPVPLARRAGRQRRIAPPGLDAQPTTRSARAATLILSAQGLVAAVAYLDAMRARLNLAALARRGGSPPPMRSATALLWRGVEAQHRVATMRLVDSLDDQTTLERLLETSKAAAARGRRRPALPAGHAVPLPLALRLALSRRHRPGRLVRREGARDRLHRGRLLALALPDGQRGPARRRTRHRAHFFQAQVKGGARPAPRTLVGRGRQLDAARRLRALPGAGARRTRHGRRNGSAMPRCAPGRHLRRSAVAGALSLPGRTGSKPGCARSRRGRR